MSDNRTPPLSTKELREAYELFPKDQLIKILIEKTLEIRQLNTKIKFLKDEL